MFRLEAIADSNPTCSAGGRTRNQRRKSTPCKINTISTAPPIDDSNSSAEQNIDDNDDRCNDRASILSTSVQLSNDDQKECDQLLGDISDFASVTTNATNSGNRSDVGAESPEPILSDLETSGSFDSKVQSDDDDQKRSNHDPNLPDCDVSIQAGTKRRRSSARLASVHAQVEDDGVATGIRRRRTKTSVSRSKSQKAEKDKPIDVDAGDGLNSGRLPRFKQLFRCSECDYKGVNKMRYRVHLAKHDKSIAVHRCEFCYQPFPSAERLTRHLVKKHADGPPEHVCPHCDGEYRTTNYRQYNRHLRAEHNVTARGERVSSPLRCEVCAYTCLFASEMRRHNERHQTNKCYKCTYTRCNYATARRGDMIKHRRYMHGGSSPPPINTVICETCGFTTNSNSKLEAHRRKHTGEKPYKCDVCSKSYADHTTFRRHGRVHLPGANSFPCFVCNKTYKQRRYLVGHLQKLHQIELPSLQLDPNSTHSAATPAAEPVMADNSDEIKTEVGESGEEEVVEVILGLSEERSREAALFDCPICRQTFTSWVHLNSHLKKAHSAKLLDNKLEKT